MSVWLVTGASRGLGAEIVAAALAAGHQVAATARDAAAVEARFPDAGSSLWTASLDVTDGARATTVIEEAVTRFGRIDVVVNNAGRGILGAVEEVSDETARAAFDTNVFGTLNVLRAALPVLRAQRSGHVINISSVGGFVGSAGWGVYNSTKFAVEGFSEALAREVGPLGISTTIVEPGYFRTDFLDGTSLHTETRVIDDYTDSAGAMRRTAETVNHDQPGDPAKAAAAIVRIGGKADAPLRLQLGPDCYARVSEKLSSVAAEQDRWKDVAFSTDHDPS
ncbi:oxidoreductase [Streptomyces sp. NPDC088794]|uniref:oxidoreductase n=1 Tax=Streptomyces sp. NPDC088794 TaxID=3365902 RepID=UPI0037F9C049